jgi:HAD superfamily hydrolase (TIGR01509 family)
MTIEAVVFDWGDTVMRDFRVYDGPMARWPRVEAVAGAAEALRALRPRYRLALATNADQSDSKLVRAALARVGLDAFFELVFVSSELGVEKPDRRFFAAALAGLALPAGEVAMVGDSYVNDIRGAHAAGLRTIWLAPPDAEPPGGGPVHDARIVGLHGLKAAVDALTAAG